MSGSSHPYPTGYAAAQQQSAMHNSLGGQFNAGGVPGLPGPMNTGLQFNLAQNANQAGQAGGPVGAMAVSQVISVTPNSSVSDSIACSQGGANNPVGRVGTVAPADNTTQVSQASRDINTASLCRIGQETVQDIVSRTQEIFQTLKTIQPPNGTIPGSNTSNEKKAKIQEQLRMIRLLFKRLRLIYEKCNENTQLQGMEYTHIESLIPLKDEWDMKSEERKNSEAYRQASEECKELMDQVVLKNKHLKEIVDHLRRIIWEINTMLAMRRS